MTLYAVFTKESEGRKTRYIRSGTARKSLKAAITYANRFRNAYVEGYTGPDHGKIVWHKGLGENY
jgi:hypothetical protein